MKKVYICLAVMVLFIIAAVAFRGPADNENPDYTKVQVCVVSSKEKDTTIRYGYSSSSMTEYEVVVSYGGKEYKLRNAHNAYSYRTGAYVDAYLYNGKLYANVEGVKNATPWGTLYSAALLGAFAMFIVSMLLLSKAGGKKKGEELL